MASIRIAVALGALAAVTAGGQAVAAGDSPSSASVSADPNGELHFNKSRLTVRHGTVTVRMHDPATSGLDHGIAIQGQGVKKIGHIVAPGQTSTLTVSLRSGSYTYFCPVPGHRQAGMRGTLVVK